MIFLQVYRVKVYQGGAHGAARRPEDGDPISLNQLYAP